MNSTYCDTNTKERGMFYSISQQVNQPKREARRRPVDFEMLMLSQLIVISRFGISFDPLSSLRTAHLPHCNSASRQISYFRRDLLQRSANSKIKERWPGMSYFLGDQRRVS